LAVKSAKLAVDKRKKRAYQLADLSKTVGNILKLSMRF
jgi:hypothetical protein